MGGIHGVRWRMEVGLGPALPSEDTGSPALETSAGDMLVGWGKRCLGRLYKLERKSIEGLPVSQMAEMGDKACRKPAGLFAAGDNRCVRRATKHGDLCSPGFRLFNPSLVQRRTGKTVLFNS
jgi:hypothetical protein